MAITLHVDGLEVEVSPGATVLDAVNRLGITLPQLWPTTTFVTLMTLIGYFQFFAEPYVMTEGGPLDRTVSVVLLMYREGFRFWKMGYAAAVAFALFAIVLSVSLAAMRLRRREEAA